MLSNAYFLAKFRFDTAENEPAKNLQNFAKFANFADPNPLTVHRYEQRLGELRRACRSPRGGDPEPEGGPEDPFRRGHLNSSISRTDLSRNFQQG